MALGSSTFDNTSFPRNREPGGHIKMDCILTLHPAAPGSILDASKKISDRDLLRVTTKSVNVVNQTNPSSTKQRLIQLGRMPR